MPTVPRPITGAPAARVHRPTGPASPPPRHGSPAASVAQAITDARAPGAPHHRAAAIDADLIPGELLFEAFTVGSLVGEGGFGKVHRARHESWELDFAIKSPNQAALDRTGGAEDFVREAERWVDLGTHPHVVRCHFVRTVRGVPRVFSEFVPGGSLSDRLRRGELRALPEVLDFWIQVCWGLAVAHAKGLVHCDVKPANVLIDESGIAKVADFGLMRGRGSAEDAGGLTQAYAPPEQWRDVPLEPGADIWACGVSVMECLLGEISWRYGSLASEVLEGAIADPGCWACAPAPGPGLLRTLKRCFAQAPSARPDALAFARALAQHFAELTGAPYTRRLPSPAHYQADSLVNRAVSLLELGRESEARAALDEAIAIEPSHLEAVFNRGLIDWRSGAVTDRDLLQRLEHCRDEGGRGALLKAFVMAECGSHAAASAALARLRSGDADPVTRRRAARAESAAGAPDQIAFEGHTREISAIALADDGSCAVSGDRRGRLRMASLARRAILMEIDVPAPYEHVVGVALAPDSDSLVSLAIENSLVLGSSEARTARVDVWAVPSGDLLRSIALTTLGPASSLAVAFRPAIALVSTRGGQIVRLDLATGATSMLLSVPPHPIECVALAADGRRAFAASARGIAVIEDVRSADARIRAAIPVTGARCVATDASGDLAVAAGLEDEVTLLALRASASSESSTMHRAAEPDRGWQVARRWIGGSFVALDGGGRTIAVGSGPNQTVGVWSAEDGRCLRTMEATGSIASVSAVAVSADGRVAAFGGDRGTLWCVRLDGSRARAEFEVVPPRGNPTTDHEEFDRRLAAARALREAGRFGESWRALEAARALPGFAQSEAALDATRTLLPHLARTGVRALVKVREFDLGLEHANVVALRADGRHAAIGSEWTQGEGRGRLACWDLEAAISAGAPRIVSEDAVGGVAYVGRTLIAATKQGLVASIDGSPPTVLAADVKCIVLSPGERVLALLRRNTGEGRIELHDLHRGVRIAEHPIGEWAHCTSVSDSGHLAWWASGAAHVLGPAAGSSPLAIAGASALLARADGSFVVGSQGRLEARAPWRLAAPVWRRAIDDAPISAMCDCAGCDLLAIGDEAGRLALVRGADGAPLSELSFGARIRALALSADGGRLLVGGAGRRAALFAIDWALDPERPSAAVHTPPEEGPSVAQLAAWLGDAR